jgi:hypothetical protein
LREAALLWFVFSLLDKLVNERLTKPWMVWNCTLTLVVWLGGTYLEIRRRPETTLRFSETMYLPLIAFAVFASILFGIGLVAGRAADRKTLREQQERERRHTA